MNKEGKMFFWIEELQKKIEEQKVITNNIILERGKHPLLEDVLKNIHEMLLSCEVMFKLYEKQKELLDSMGNNLSRYLSLED